MKNEVKRKMRKKLHEVDVRKSRERKSRAKVNQNFLTTVSRKGANLAAREKMARATKLEKSDALISPACPQRWRVARPTERFRLLSHL
jgi:hypothetical protein